MTLSQLAQVARPHTATATHTTARLAYIDASFGLGCFS